MHKGMCTGSLWTYHSHSPHSSVSQGKTGLARVGARAGGICVALCLALGAWTGPALGASIVVPGDLSDTEGDFGNVFPFMFFSTPGSYRYQQVYAAAEFSALTGPESITQIAFRPNAGSAPFGPVSLTDIEIRLSTTPLGPDGLSPAFADNVGPDETLVYDGSLSLTSAATGPVGGPLDFDVVINLETPFPYDPDAGNLLLDVKNYAPAFISALDASSNPADTVSRTVSTFITGSAEDPSGSTETFGLVTRFLTVPGSIEAIIDIKFCSNPNAFNCKKKGVLPVTVFGTDALDVLDIDPSSLRLCLASDIEECAGPPRDISVVDRGDPAADLGAESCAVIEVEEGVFEEQYYRTPDGLPDLEIAFEATEIRAMLGDYCDIVAKGDPLPPLVLRAATWDGTAVESTIVPSPGVDQLIKVNR